MKDLIFEPQARCEAIHSCGGCYFKDYIYVFGGLYGTNFTNQSKKYSIQDKTWTKIQDLCENFSKTTASVIKDKIYVTGIESSSLYIYYDNIDSYKAINCKGISHRVLVGNFIIGISENSNALFKLENKTVKHIKYINYEINYLNNCSSVRYEKGVRVLGC